VSGRVSGPEGRGLRNTVVVLTDPLNLAQQATTSSFGFYQFNDVQPGHVYTIRVISKSYRFALRTVNVASALTNVDFVGLE
jgi:hypothetical protein